MLAGTLPAQTPAQPQPAAAPSDEVVALPSFEVSTKRDYGYRAANSISATRTDTPIKDVAMNIQVFTKDLSDDLVITNSVDLEAYDASVTNGGADRHSDMIIQQSYQNFIFRGFRQNWGLRDGIREYDPVDLQNIQRVEYVKGPAAALYGLAYPGGVQQNITKTADLTRNFTEIRASYGSYDEWRTTVDSNVTGTIKGTKVAVRVNGARGQTGDERAHSRGLAKLEAATITWMATPTTSVQLMSEYAFRRQPNGIGPEQYSRGETDSAGNALSNHADIPLQIFHPEIPWNWNWASGKNYTSLETHIDRLTLTQSVGENFSVTGYMQYSDRVNIAGSGWDANGSGGSDSWESPNSGWITDASGDRIQSTYHYRDWCNNMHAYGATAVYKLDLDLGSVGKMKNIFAFGTAAWAEKEISRASHETNPIPIVFPLRVGISTNVPNYPPGDLVPESDGGPNGNGYHHENNSNDYYYLNWQGAFLDNRLKFMAGANKTNIKLVTWNNGASTSPDNRFTSSKVSPLFSGMFDITKDVSVYVLHSTSLFPDSTKDSFGHQFAPQVGTSWEGGVKVEMLEGRLSGTVALYKIDQTGGTQNDPNANNTNTAKWDRETDAQRAIDFPGKSRSDLLGDVIEGGKQESKGVEADVIYQPLRQWQIKFSYAHNDHKFVTSAVPSTIGETYPWHVKDQASVLTKYTFSDGVVKGLALGLGVHGGTKTLMDYQSWNGHDVARYEPSRTTAEVFGQYRTKLFGYDWTAQLNIKNITKTPDYVGWKATGSSSVLATQKYKYELPVRYTFTLGLDL